MKSKTIILISWPLSLALALWIGTVIGINFGRDLGISDFHTEKVRYYQLDVADAAQQRKGSEQELLLATADLAGTMINRKRYEAAREEFFEKVRSLPSGK